ncbi:alpha/beta hydrolase [Spirosoma pollinicola]|uniref:Alpha/beta hydrolase n=1 Tax=Spirosoma pollinicola TaxID=2057025 RepID=A0A2K8YUC4_9BACT|nr:alpha/beta hydrolase [Spirosoma pollinicola]AUD01230.1 alpha/beta hydrolase [Spirosoma pollinicola]
MLNRTLRHIALPCLLLVVTFCKAQPTNPVRSIFPTDTRFIANVPYAGDTLKRHLLDIYLPAQMASKPPLVVWVHGGAWMLNDKYADMSYMKNTVRSILEKGYAFASIDYRYSTTAPFPAQIQDCNQALEFLYQNAAKYGYDRNRIALVGFSAGGHLASLLALSANNSISDFYINRKKPSFRIKTVVDFYGPSDFLALMRRDAPLSDTSVVTSESRLLGASPLRRPDLAKIASPVTYIDRNDPPFLIIQGEKDESVPAAQSVLLSSWLTLAQVKNRLIIVPGAPHYGTMFDSDFNRQAIFEWLDTYLK